MLYSHLGRRLVDTEEIKHLNFERKLQYCIQIVSETHIYNFEALY